LPFYEFQRAGKKKVVHAPMSRLPGLVEEMKRDGWARLFSIPAIIVTPGYREALEETDQVMADEDRKMASDRREAKADLARAVKEEYGTP